MAKTGRMLASSLLALVLIGCANGSSPTAAPSVPVASPSSNPDSPAPSPTPAASLATASPTVAARVYPYTLLWPEEELVTEWRYAETPWDGQARIDHGNAYTDSVQTQDGDLFAFGYQTSTTAADLQALVAGQAAEWHGCDLQPIEEAPVTGGGEDGILAVHDCGGRRVLRWFAAHDGFGLAVGLILATDADLDLVRSRFEERLGTLTWDR